MLGCGVNIFGRISVGISQYRVIGTSPTKVGLFACSFSHRPKSTVPGNGVIITNCANVTPAFSAISTVASNVAGFIRGKPEDERTEHVNAMLSECLQLLRQSLARVVEVFEDSFESFRRQLPPEHP
jgi:hypothetical protein